MTQALLLDHAVALPLPALITPPAPPLLLWRRPLEAALNRLFSEPLREGALDFLRGRWLRIRMDRPAVDFALTLEQGRLRVAAPRPGAALTIRGGLKEYLALVSRRDDADTLFFQRRLHMNGDTELGLFVKNFLDGVDPKEHPALGLVSRLAAAALAILERVPPPPLAR